MTSGVHIDASLVSLGFSMEDFLLTDAMDADVDDAQDRQSIIDRCLDTTPSKKSVSMSKIFFNLGIHPLRG